MACAARAPAWPPPMITTLSRSAMARSADGIIHAAIQETAMIINLLGWEGYDDPSVVAPFEQVAGTRVVAQSHLSDFAATQRVVNAEERWDIVNLNSPFVRD